MHLFLIHNWYLLWVFSFLSFSFFLGRLLNLRGAKYERLQVADPWAGLDDDEDDELLFTGSVAPKWPSEHDTVDDDPIEGDVHENGHGKYKRLEQMTLDIEDEEQFVYDRRLLERQGSPLYKYRKFSFRKSDRCCGCIKNRCLCGVLLTVVAIVIICLVYFLIPHHHQSSSSPSESPPLSSLPSPLPISRGLSSQGPSSQEFAVNITGGMSVWTHRTKQFIVMNIKYVFDVCTLLFNCITIVALKFSRSILFSL